MPHLVYPQRIYIPNQCSFVTQPSAPVAPLANRSDDIDARAAVIF